MVEQLATEAQFAEGVVGKGMGAGVGGDLGWEVRCCGCHSVYPLPKISIIEYFNHTLQAQNWAAGLCWMPEMRCRMIFPV